MLEFILLIICASACALPSSIITQDAEKINLQSTKELTLPSGRRSDVVGIVGGNETTIYKYPFAVIILWAEMDNTMTWFCCGTILSSRSVLTAAHCKTQLEKMRLRVGSYMAYSGGKVHTLASSIEPHPNTGIAIVRSAESIVLNDCTVKPAVIAGADYNLPDNETVWVVGWGATKENGEGSDLLRHVQIFTINQKICQDLYNKPFHHNITENELCAGVLDVGGKGACEGDNGAPLVHNGVVVGLYRGGIGCAKKEYPGIYTRVSRFADWIEKNK